MMILRIQIVDDKVNHLLTGNIEQTAKSVKHVRRETLPRSYLY